MILKYDFDYDRDPFEFELDSEDKEYCIECLPKELLVDILSEYQEEMDPEELAEIKEDLANGKETSLRLWAFEKFDELDDFEEIAKDFFEETAKEVYDDNRAYNSDPLGYYGLSQSDFI